MPCQTVIVSLLFFALLGRVGVAQPTSPDDKLPPAPAGKTWQLAWQDEFDGPQIDTQKWGGSIEDAKLPDCFRVDYVRVYDLIDKP